MLNYVRSILGIRTVEEPPYAVTDRVGWVEVRRYAARIAAQTTVRADDDAARNIGFRRLANYIFGRTKIAMTAPVAQSIAMTAPVAQSDSTDGGSVIRFYMPAKWTMDTLPRPESVDVKLVDVPAEMVAVLRFTGDRSAAAVRRRTEELREALASTAYKPLGEPTAWFYDPPFTLPFRRRNEVAVAVGAA